jgi:hypothetical protein
MECCTACVPFSPGREGRSRASGSGLATGSDNNDRSDRSPRRAAAGWPRLRLEMHEPTRLPTAGEDWIAMRLLRSLLIAPPDRRQWRSRRGAKHELQMGGIELGSPRGSLPHLKWKSPITIRSTYRVGNSATTCRIPSCEACVVVCVSVCGALKWSHG